MSGIGKRHHQNGFIVHALIQQTEKCRITNSMPHNMAYQREKWMNKGWVPLVTGEWGQAHEGGTNTTPPGDADFRFYRYSPN